MRAVSMLLNGDVRGRKREEIWGARPEVGRGNSVVTERAFLVIRNEITTTTDMYTSR